MFLKFLKKDDYTLAYTHIPAKKKAPALVFLPGFRSDMSGLKATFLREFAQENGFGFISLDYYGHGQSEGLVEHGSLSQWISDALCVLEQCGDRKYILVGSSMGGWIMLHVALQRPDLICGLVGVAPAPDFTKHLMERIPGNLKQDYETNGFFMYPTPLNADGWPMLKPFIEDGLQNCLLHNPVSINLPVRLLHGCDDDEVPHSTSMVLMKKLTSTDVQVRLIKDGNHRLCRETDLALLAESILSLPKEALC